MENTFDSVARGLNEAIRHARGKEVAVKIHRPAAVDVAALRHDMGMTQEQFAAQFGFSVATLRHWERGDRSPHGAALVLLNVIKHAPETVKTALNASL